MRHAIGSVLCVMVLGLGACRGPGGGATIGPATMAPSETEFPAAKGLLSGFEDFRPGGKWSAGDSVLLGIAMEGPRISRRWYLRATVLGTPEMQGGEGATITFHDEIRVRYGEGKERGGWVRVPFDLAPILIEMFDENGRELQRMTAMQPEICLRYGLTDYIELERAGKTFYDGLTPGPSGGEPVAGEEQLRMLAGWLAIMKLPEFLQRDSMQRVLWELIEKPSLVSIVWNRGVKLSLEMNPREAALADPGDVPAGDPVYRVPMNIAVNGAVAMRCELLLARPTPPLGPCTGLLGIDAVNPRDSSKRVTVRLLAARKADVKRAWERGKPPEAPPSTRPSGARDPWSLHSPRPAAASPSGSGP